MCWLLRHRGALTGCEKTRVRCASLLEVPSDRDTICGNTILYRNTPTVLPTRPKRDTPSTAPCVKAEYPVYVRFCLQHER